MNKALSFDNISFAYNSKELVLENVSFSIQEKTISALLGINGAGKSTILWLSVSVLTPSMGEIYLWEDRLLTLDNNKKKKIGFLGFNNPLFEYFTIDEHLRYVAILYNIPRQTIESRIVNLKAIFNLNEYNGKFCYELSSGNKRKVGIITTLIHDPELLIWDEPFNGLDPIAAVRLEKLMLALREKGKTILFTSQILSHVKNISDKVILLDKRRIVLENELTNIKNEMNANKLETFEEYIFKIGDSGNSFSDFDI